MSSTYLNDRGYDWYTHGHAVLSIDKGVTRDDIAHHGKIILFFPADTLFGGVMSAPYTSPVLENPTWAEALAEVAKSIEQTGDRHHCYLEVLTYEFVGAKDGVAIWTPFLGS